jgi:hypothetical protein
MLEFQMRRSDLEESFVQVLMNEVGFLSESLGSGDVRFGSKESENNETTRVA